MHPARLNEDGSLQKEFKPAIYVDTNFLRHYYNAEGAEFLFDENGNTIDPPWKDDSPEIPSSLNDSRHKLILDITNPKDYFKDFGCIRHLTAYCLSEASLILTPLSLLELFKLHAEVAFKDICAESLGAKQIQRMGEKEVGKHLSALYSRWLADNQNEVLKGLIQDCDFNMSFARAHGLQGTFYVSDHNIRITDGDVGSFLWILSFLQLETTDVLHLHSAKKLGCEYFATFDKGFATNKDIIKKAAGIQILCSAKEVLNILKQYRKKNA
jgi:hypothetical protein